MGFFGKEEVPEDEIQSAPPDPDLEKRIPSHEETGPVQPHQPVIAPAVIDPELEKRVLRKLDWRVPTLMGFFCKSARGNKGTDIVSSL